MVDGTTSNSLISTPISSRSIIECRSKSKGTMNSLFTMKGHRMI